MSETTVINVDNIPASVIAFLRPLAVREGHGDSKAAAVRWATIQYEKILREQETQSST